MTPKQKLLEHLKDWHPYVPRPARFTMADLASLHANAHYRRNPNHYHVGVNRGPGERPPGWRTGADPVRKT